MRVLVSFPLEALDAFPNLARDAAKCADAADSYTLAGQSEVIGGNADYQGLHRSQLDLGAGTLWDMIRCRRSRSPSRDRGSTGGV